MGKRTLRALHFEMVAEQLRKEYEPLCLCVDKFCSCQDQQRMLRRLAHAFADEFEIRAENFQRDKFLKSCGLEE